MNGFNGTIKCVHMHTCYVIRITKDRSAESFVRNPHFPRLLFFRSSEVDIAEFIVILLFIEIIVHFRQRITITHFLYRHVNPKSEGERRC